MIWLLCALACGDDDPIDESCTPSDEVCDGLDNDCDGDIDEDVLDTVYADADGDGLGNPAAPNDACGTDWPGYSDNADDCNDSDASLPMEAWPDGDGDGYASELSDSAMVCDLSGYTTELGDCDDADAGVSPGAEEICDDLVDNDCDDSVDEDCDPGDSGPVDSG
ncbi:MAG TPA: MopE-related protein [Myxococcota bacterium]|nr:MopE-related protein [Myxococcota bacterium]